VTGGVTVCKKNDKMSLVVTGEKTTAVVFIQTLIAMYKVVQASDLQFSTRERNIFVKVITGGVCCRTASIKRKRNAVRWDKNIYLCAAIY
jgi:hypothetical protein